MEFVHSVAVNAPIISPMLFENLATDRSSAFRSSVLSFEDIISIVLRSGR